MQTHHLLRKALNLRVVVVVVVVARQSHVYGMRCCDGWMDGSRVKQTDRETERELQVAAAVLLSN